MNLLKMEIDKLLKILKKIKIHPYESFLNPCESLKSKIHIDSLKIHQKIHLRIQPLRTYESVKEKRFIDMKIYKIYIYIFIKG